MDRKTSIKYGMLIKAFPIIYILSFVFNFKEFSFGTSESYGKTAVIFSFAVTILALVISELHLHIRNYGIDFIKICLIFWAGTTAILLVCWIGTGAFTIALAFLICPFWGIMQLSTGHNHTDVIFLIVCMSETIRLAVTLRRMKKGSYNV